MHISIIHGNSSVRGYCLLLSTTVACHCLPRLVISLPHLGASFPLLLVSRASASQFVPPITLASGEMAGWGTAINLRKKTARPSSVVIAGIIKLTTVRKVGRLIAYTCLCVLVMSRLFATPNSGKAKSVLANLFLQISNWKIGGLLHTGNSFTVSCKLKTNKF